MRSQSQGYDPHQQRLDETLKQAYQVAELKRRQIDQLQGSKRAKENFELKYADNPFQFSYKQHNAPAQNLPPLPPTYPNFGQQNMHRINQPQFANPYSYQQPQIGSNRDVMPEFYSPIKPAGPQQFYESPPQQQRFEKSPQITFNPQAVNTPQPIIQNKIAYIPVDLEQLQGYQPFQKLNQSIPHYGSSQNLMNISSYQDQHVDQSFQNNQYPRESQNPFIQNAMGIIRRPISHSHNNSKLKLQQRYPNPYNDPKLQQVIDTHSMQSQYKQLGQISKDRRRMLQEYEQVKKKTIAKKLYEEELAVQTLRQHEEEKQMKEESLKSAMSQQQQLILQLVNQMQTQKTTKTSSKNDVLLKQLKKMEMKDKKMKHALNMALVQQTASGAPPPVQIPFQGLDSDSEGDDLSLDDDDIDRE